jgi:hypothetical protein
MSQQIPDPVRWLADLMKVQHSLWHSAFRPTEGSDG